MPNLKYFYRSTNRVWRADHNRSAYHLEAVKSSSGYRLLKVLGDKGVELANCLTDLRTVEIVVDTLGLSIKPSSKAMIESGDWELRFLRRVSQNRYTVDRLQGGRFDVIGTGEHYTVKDTITDKELSLKVLPRTLQEAETVILDTGEVLLIGGEYDRDGCLLIRQKNTPLKRRSVESESTAMRDRFMETYNA